MMMSSNFIYIEIATIIAARMKRIFILIVESKSFDEETFNIPNRRTNARDKLFIEANKAKIPCTHHRRA